MAKKKNKPEIEKKADEDKQLIAGPIVEQKEPEKIEPLKNPEPEPIIQESDWKKTINEATPEPEKKGLFGWLFHRKK